MTRKEVESLVANARDRGERPDLSSMAALQS